MSRPLDPPAAPAGRETPRLTAGRRAERAARERRLAQALRNNLKRRKEQARAKAGRADADEPRG